MNELIIEGTGVETTLRFFVVGDPAPQGSKRIGKNRRTGQATLIESSKKLKPWREAVNTKASEIARNYLRGIDVPVLSRSEVRMFDSAVFVRIRFLLRRPKTVKRALPECKPDVDKLIRSTLDGLKPIWTDDALVVEVYASKRYASDDEPAGAFVVIGNVNELTYAKIDNLIF